MREDFNYKGKGSESQGAVAKVTITLVTLLCLLTAPLTLLAQGSDEKMSTTFHRGVVLKVLEDGVLPIAGFNQPYQKLRIEVQNGPDKGKSFVVEYGGADSIQESEKVKVGEHVVLIRGGGEKEPTYTIDDRYRLSTLWWIAGLFFVVALIFGRKKGLTSLLGMIFSVMVLVLLIIPGILKGGSPLLLTLLGGSAISVISIYLAHGFNKRTTIAVVSTLATLSIATGLTLWSVFASKISGAAHEETWFLQLQGFQGIDARGLLMAGIIIGVLGILDDITTAQVAVVDELHKANEHLSKKEIYKRALSVGQEHIASLINTLILAYAGAAFPLLILFSIDATPWWVIVNQEFVAEEVLRTLIGSIALVAAVPISTLLATFFLIKKQRHG